MAQGINRKNNNSKSRYDYKHQHSYYLKNRDRILEKKKEYNQIPEVKERNKINHQNYYLQHKEELNQKHKEYRKNKKRKNLRQK